MFIASLRQSRQILLSANVYGGWLSELFPYRPASGRRTDYPAAYTVDGNPFRYCGEYYDEELGYVYLRARYYEPATGRFVTEDSVRARRMNIFDPYGDYQGAQLSGGVFVDNEKGQFIVNDPLSLNLYTYCENNPVRFQDPEGNFILTCIIVGAIIGAVVGGVIGANISKQQLGYVNGWYVAGGAVGGAVVGGLIGWGVGAAATAIGATMTAGSGGTLGTVILNRWQDAETAVRNAYNAVKYTFNIPGMASRVVDGFNKAKGIIYEVKYGATSLSQFVQSEIARDVWIRNNVQGVNAIEWHFYISQATGQGGPSGPLLKALAEAGIKVVFH